MNTDWNRPKSEPDYPSVYIAAPWVDKDIAAAAKEKFQAAGLRVTARWIDLHMTDEQEKDEAIRSVEAMNDVEDVITAEILVLLNTQKSEGKAVETGIAIGLCKGIVLVGEPSNVFHFLKIPRCKTVEEAIEICKNYPWEYVPEEFLQSEGD